MSIFFAFSLLPPRCASAALHLDFATCCSSVIYLLYFHFSFDLRELSTAASSRASFRSIVHKTLYVLKNRSFYCSVKSHLSIFQRYISQLFVLSFIVRNIINWQLYVIAFYVKYDARDSKQLNSSSCSFCLVLRHCSYCCMFCSPRPAGSHSLRLQPPDFNIVISGYLL